MTAIANQPQFLYGFLLCLNQFSHIFIKKNNSEIETTRRRATAAVQLLLKIPQLRILRPKRRIREYEEQIHPKPKVMYTWKKK